MAVNRIQMHRERCGITRERLATMIGKSYASVVAYEQGNRDPDTVVWKKLAEIFDRSVDELMGGESKHGQVSPDLEKDWPDVIQVLRMSGQKASPEERKRIAKIIRLSLGDDN